MRLALTILALVLSFPASAQTMPAPAAASTPVPGCPTPQGLSVKDGGGLTIAQSANAMLAQDARFAIAPGHAPAAGTFGGSFALTIAAAGRYRVGVTPGVWIDMFGGGRSIASVAHQRGTCKLVDFDLAPGRYTLQLSGSGAPSMGLLVSRAPSP